MLTTAAARSRSDQSDRDPHLRKSNIIARKDGNRFPGSRHDFQPGLSPLRLPVLNATLTAWPARFLKRQNLVPLNFKKGITEGRF